MPRGTPLYTLERGLSNPRVAPQANRVRDTLTARNTKARVFTADQVRVMVQREVDRAHAPPKTRRSDRALRGIASIIAEGLGNPDPLDLALRFLTHPRTATVAAAAAAVGIALAAGAAVLMLGWA